MKQDKQTLAFFSVCLLLVLVWAVVLPTILIKRCHPEMGVGIYSGFYSSPHVFGVVGDYRDDYDFEFGGYITGDDAKLRSAHTGYFMQANFKQKIDSGNHLIYGFSAEFFVDGIVLGNSYSGVSYGPYIGIERAISENVRLRALYHPVYVTSLDVGGMKTTRTDFGLNGAFGIMYLFQ